MKSDRAVAAAVSKRSERRVKVAFFLERPTQFDTPLFRHGASDERTELKVVYTAANSVERGIFDSEIGRSVFSDMDLYAGYSFAQMPPKGWASWLLREFRRESYDVVVVNGYHRARLVAAALVARAVGAKIALRVDSVPSHNRGVANAVAKRLLYKAAKQVYARFLAVSSLTRQYLLSIGVRNEAIGTLGYPVDVGYFRAGSEAGRQARREVCEQYGLKVDVPVILAVSKFCARESPWDLLRAMRSVRAAGVMALLVGDGPERTALESFANRYLSDCVRFAGYVSYRDLPPCYGIADLFVHAVGNEPWGVSVGEALASGLPVIASSEVGSGYDLIDEGKNGYRYRYGDAEQLTSKIDEALEKLDRQQIEVASRRILAEWDISAMWRNLSGMALELAD